LSREKEVHREKSIPLEKQVEKKEAPACRTKIADATEKKKKRKNEKQGKAA